MTSAFFKIKSPLNYNMLMMMIMGLMITPKFNNFVSAIGITRVYQQGGSSSSSSPPEPNRDSPVLSNADPDEAMLPGIEQHHRATVNTGPLILRRLIRRPKRSRTPTIINTTEPNMAHNFSNSPIEVETVEHSDTTNSTANMSGTGSGSGSHTVTNSNSNSDGSGSGDDDVPPGPGPESDDPVTVTDLNDALNELTLDGPSGTTRLRYGNPNQGSDINYDMMDLVSEASTPTEEGITDELEEGNLRGLFDDLNNNIGDADDQQNVNQAQVNETLDSTEDFFRKYCLNNGKEPSRIEYINYVTNLWSRLRPGDIRGLHDLAGPGPDNFNLDRLLEESTGTLITEIEKNVITSNLDYLRSNFRNDQDSRINGPFPVVTARPIPEAKPKAQANLLNPPADGNGGNGQENLEKAEPKQKAEPKYIYSFNREAHFALQNLIRPGNLYPTSLVGSTRSGKSLLATLLSRGFNRESNFMIPPRAPEPYIMNQINMNLNHNLDNANRHHSLPGTHLEHGDHLVEDVREALKKCRDSDSVETVRNLSQRALDDFEKHVTDNLMEAATRDQKISHKVLYHILHAGDLQDVVFKALTTNYLNSSYNKTLFSPFLPLDTEIMGSKNTRFEKQIDYLEKKAQLIKGNRPCPTAVLTRAEFIRALDENGVGILTQTNLNNDVFPELFQELLFSRFFGKNSNAETSIDFDKFVQTFRDIDKTFNHFGQANGRKNCPILPTEENRLSNEMRCLPCCHNIVSQEVITGQLATCNRERRQGCCPACRSSLTEGAVDQNTLSISGFIRIPYTRPGELQIMDTNFSEITFDNVDEREYINQRFEELNYLTRAQDDHVNNADDIRSVNDRILTRCQIRLIEMHENDERFEFHKQIVFIAFDKCYYGDRSRPEAKFFYERPRLINVTRATRATDNVLFKFWMTLHDEFRNLRGPRSEHLWRQIHNLDVQEVYNPEAEANRNPNNNPDSEPTDEEVKVMKEAYEDVHRFDDRSAQNIFTLMNVLFASRIITVTSNITDNDINPNTNRVENRLLTFMNDLLNFGNLFESYTNNRINSNNNRKNCEKQESGKNKIFF